MTHPLHAYDEFPATALPTYPEDDHTGDGYDWMRQLPAGWNAIGLWGINGWDLGGWPYQVIAHYDHPLDVLFGVALYIEGDVTVRAFGSREARDDATAEIALDAWLALENGPREGLPAQGTPASGIPARFRVPYRRK